MQLTKVVLVCQGVEEFYEEYQERINDLMEWLIKSGAKIADIKVTIDGFSKTLTTIVYTISEENYKKIKQKRSNLK